MSYMEAIKSGFSNYAKFNGRASRSEFWWFVLFMSSFMPFSYAILGSRWADCVRRDGVNCSVYWPAFGHLGSRLADLPTTDPRSSMATFT